VKYSASKRIDVASLKLRSGKSPEWVSAAEIFRQMRGEFRSSEDARIADRPSNTDTKSDVSVAVSEARPRFATHFATDQRLRSAENISNSHPVGEGGRGSAYRAGGLDSVPVRVLGILLPNAPAGFERALSNAVCSEVRAREKAAGGTTRLEPTAE
jgi:hypothetical protein